jgi:hypothetical protein
MNQMYVYVRPCGALFVVTLSFPCVYASVLLVAVECDFADEIRTRVNLYETPYRDALPVCCCVTAWSAGYVRKSELTTNAGQVCLADTRALFYPQTPEKVEVTKEYKYWQGATVGLGVAVAVTAAIAIALAVVVMIIKRIHVQTSAFTSSSVKTVTNPIGQP